MIHSKSLKRALAFLMVIVIMFVTIFTDNVVKRVLVRAGDNVEAGSGSDGEDANPSANPSANPDEGTGEDETIIKDCTLLKTGDGYVNYIGEKGKTVEFTLSDSVTNVSKVEWGYVTNGACDTLNEITVDSDNKYKFDLTTENMTENDNYTIRIVVTDTDNKVKYIDYTIVLNKTKNEIQNCNLDEEANRTIGINGKTVEFTVNNTDTVDVERAEWCYVTDGTCGEFHEISVDKDDANKYKFDIGPGEDMTGEVTVKVKITNVLGNVDEKDYTLTVDRSVLTIENCSLKENITNVLGENPTSVSFNVINGKGNVEWGYVTDNVYNKKAELDETDGKYEFEISPSEIADGKVHIVRIITTNELGNSAEKEYDVKVDYEAPEIDDIDPDDLYIDKDGKDITVRVTDDTYEIKSVTWNYEDGNSTQNAATSNNDGTFTFNLKPEEGMTDGKYTICVTATNELGNSTKKEYDVCMDTTAPSINDLKYENADKLYKGEWINSHNINDISIVTNIADNISGVESINVYKTSGEWTEDNLKKAEMLNLNYEFENGNFKLLAAEEELPEGSYTLVIVAKDKCGNKGYKSIEVKKSLTLPSGIIESDVGNWNDWWLNKEKNVTFGIFKEDKITLELNYNTDSVDAYYCVVSGADNIKNINDGTEITQENWKDYVDEQKITLSPSQVAVVYAKFVDTTTGNTSYVLSDGIVIDNNPENISIEVTNKNAKDTWINTIEDIEYTLKSGVSGFEQYQIIKYVGTNKVDLKCVDIEKTNIDYSKSDDLEKKIILGTRDNSSYTLDEGDYEVEVNVISKTGVEKSGGRVHIMYDNTAPEVEFIEKQNEWINADNKDNKTLEVEVTDAKEGKETSGVKKVSVYTYTPNSDSDVPSDNNARNWKENTNYSISDLDNDKMKIKLGDGDFKDGEYYVIVEATDTAGNTNFAYQQIKKDTNASEISIIANEEAKGWVNGNNKDNAKFDVTIEDKTSRVGIVSVYTYTPNSDSDVPSDNNVRNWEKNTNYSISDLDNDKMKIKLGDDDFKDGEYYVIVEVTDKSGNKNFAYRQIKKDTNASEISITASEDAEGWINENNKNKAKFDVTIDDTTSKVETVSVYTYTPDNKEKPKYSNYGGWKKNTNYSESKLDADGKMTIKLGDDDFKDGEYYVIVEVTDKARNKNFAYRQIKKDTNESVINITASEDAEGWINGNNKDNAKFDVTIDDTTSKVETVSVYTYTPDNKEKPKYSNYGGWKKNTNYSESKLDADGKMTIKLGDDDFKDGEYYVIVEVTDKARNKNFAYRQIKKDTNESVINITASEDAEGWINGNNKDNAKFDVTIKDTTSKVKTVSVYTYTPSSDSDVPSDNNTKSWKKNKNYTKKKLDADGKMTIGLGSEDFEDGKYYVIVKVTDTAGNKNFAYQQIKKDTNVNSIEITTSEEAKGWINIANRGKATYTVKADDNISKFDSVTIYTYKGKGEPSDKNKENWDEIGTVLYDGKHIEDTGELDDFDDGEYYVVAVVKDVAGNEDFRYIYIKKDTKNPDINLSKENIPDNGWINKNNDAALINMEVTDNNIEQTSGIYESTIYRYIGTDELTNGYIKNNRNNKKLFKKLSYGLSGDKLERTGTIKNLNSDSDSNLPDGDYWIVLYVTDKAGNSNYATLEIKKDITEPTGSISLTNGPKEWTSTEWKDKISFNTFKNDANGTEFRFEYDDTTSKIAKVSYYYTKKNVLENKEDSSVGWREIRDVKNNKESYITIGKDSEDDMNAVIYLKIEDTAGNVSYLRSDGIIFDHHKPDGLPEYNRSTFISVNTDTSSLSANGIYKSVPTVSYAIEDPKMANDTYSGLKTISYKVTNKDNGKTMGVNNVTEGAKDYSGIIDLAALGDEIYNYNDVSIRITATDRAENTYTTDTPLTLSIDTTKPIVNVSYKDSTGAEVEPNGRFFNNDITMVVTVTERNFDADATLFRINGQQISLNGMTLVGDAPAGGNGDGDTHTYEYRFTGDEANDKDYTVEYVSCTDKAGNASDSVITPQTFTVDKVQPTVSANDAAGYSSSELTYTATVVERNFDEAGAKVLVTKRLNGSLSYENREYPVIWSTSGDTHTAALSFAEDGDYSFTITCTDKAGNQQAAVYTSKEFTVDNVDPVLTSNISEENNNIANKGNIDFEYVYTDINSSNESGMIGYKVRTLAGTAVNDWVPEIKNVNVDGVNGYTIKFHDNATATKLKDGIYTIELTVKDKAGREAKDEKQFSVNRHGSAYSYISSSYTGAVILQQYVKEITDDIEVVVMNCDDITQYQVEVWNSLNEQNILKPDEDYTWKKENSGYVYKEDNSNRESGFTMYSCKIKPEVFSNEGTYTVRVSTKDIADDAAYGDNAALLYNDDTNTDNNMDITTNMDAAQADKIEFTVDRTNPEIVIMDIDNNGKYNLDKKFSFDYADANELDDIKFVRKDGDKVLETITYKPSDLKDLKTGNISAVAKEYDGYQTITISATDKAGNTGSASVKVLVTSNLWIKYINNTPLVVATIVVVAAAAGGIFFVLFRRRRRGEQN